MKALQLLIMHSSAIGKKNSRTGQLVLLKTIALLVLFLALPNNKLHAQNDSLYIFLKVKLKDRSNFIGALLSESKDSLVLRRGNGVIVTLLRSDIRYSYKVQPGKISKGKYRPDLFNYDKGFMNAHAYGPKKGEVYFENSMLVWNELNVGLNDYISLRIGFDTYGMGQRIFDDYYSEYYEPILLIAPKFSFPIIKNRWHFAITPAVLNIPDNDGFLDYGVLFLSNSFGNKNNNLTIGIGTQVFGNGGAFENSYFTFSANLRVSPRIAITTENWTIPNRDNYNNDFDYIVQLNSLGVKILGQHLNWSITLVRFKEWGDDYVNHIPIAGIALPISRGGGWKN
jgi:hypothetical protein